MEKQKIDAKEMIATIYFMIQASRDLIDQPKEFIRCKKASIKIEGQIQSKFDQPAEFSAEQPDIAQNRDQSRT